MWCMTPAISPPVSLPVLFKTAGMVILPCSMKTLSGIVHSYTDGLLTRAADVVLKERRPLVLCVRETPFHLGHLRLLVQAAELGR